MASFSLSMRCTIEFAERANVVAPVDAIALGERFHRRAFDIDHRFFLPIGSHDHAHPLADRFEGI